MDEMWQRHKSFIVQVVVGGVLFLVAFFVMRSMYGDENDPERIRSRNADRLRELQSKLDGGHAPSSASIEKQRANANATEALKWDLAKRVSSVAGRDEKTKEADREKAYVRENIAWTLANIGRQDEGFVDLYDKVPQACLSKLRDAAKTVEIGKAAQSGKEVDETMGLGAFPDDEIPQALHGLAIVTDVMERCLAKPGIDKITPIRVTSRRSFPDENGVNFMSAIGVHVEIVGNPAEVNEVIRSFNSVDRKDRRMTVLESIESIVPLSADEDTVKASLNVVGLRYESSTQAEGK